MELGHTSINPATTGKPADEAEALLRHALALQTAAEAGSVPPLLRGKTIGLITEDTGAAATQLFDRAARELGARVSFVQPSLTHGSSNDEIRATAKLLGQLYDALDCEGMAPDVIDQLKRCTDIPVFDGIAGADHATARLADQLESRHGIEARRRYVVQAVLVNSMT